LNARGPVWAIAVLAAALMFFEAALTSAADDTKVNAATSRVESGARTIGGGVSETAKGIGQTVVEGAKYSGERIQESAKAAEPQAKSAGASVRDAAISFGRSVKTFFGRMFGG
jgi:hypothetical protein